MATSLHIFQQTTFTITTGYEPSQFVLDDIESSNEREIRMNYSQGEPYLIILTKGHFHSFKLDHELDESAYQEMLWQFGLSDEENDDASGALSIDRNGLFHLLP